MVLRKLREPPNIGSNQQLLKYTKFSRIKFTKQNELIVLHNVSTLMNTLWKSETTWTLQLLSSLLSRPDDQSHVKFLKANREF